MGCDICAGRACVYLSNTHSNIHGLGHWYLCTKGYRLQSGGHKIELTVAECRLLLAFITSSQRVLSKDSLIRALNKDPDTYTGLEMCLSRLQKKFCAVSGERRLVRAVRNCGYCLVQKLCLAEV